MWSGNKNLRGENEQIEYTEEMIDEYIKCEEDMIYFAEKYITINTLDQGKIKITLYDFQKKILKAIDSPKENLPHTIVCVPRQAGKCVSFESYLTIRNKKTGKIEKIKIGDFYKTIINNDC